MTKPKKARINELNICKKLLQDEIHLLVGTPQAHLVYGLHHAIKVLMDHKKAIRPDEVAVDIRGPQSLQEQRTHAARMKGEL